MGRHTAALFFSYAFTVANNAKEITIPSENKRKDGEEKTGYASDYERHCTRQPYLHRSKLQTFLFSLSLYILRRRYFRAEVDILLWVIALGKGGGRGWAPFKAFAPADYILWCHLRLGL